jgi:hypothetical protein
MRLSTSVPLGKPGSPAAAAAKLQSSGFAREERVVLNDHDWSSVCNGRCLRDEGLNARNVRLDLDVSWHERPDSLLFFISFHRCCRMKNEKEASDT